VKISRRRMLAGDLTYFDALVFASTTGELDLTKEQKQEMMFFFKDDGKGSVGIHAGAVDDRREHSLASTARGIAEPFTAQEDRRALFPV
jgi:hypothetical protein